MDKKLEHIPISETFSTNSAVSKGLTNKFCEPQGYPYDQGGQPVEDCMISNQYISYVSGYIRVSIIKTRTNTNHAVL